MKKPTIKKLENALKKLVKVSRFLTSICAMLLPFIHAFANVQDSLKVVIDRTPIVPKKFSENISEKYNGEEFNYDKIEGEAGNLITRFLRSFLEWLANLLGFTVSPLWSTIFEYLVYGILGAVVVYIIIKLLVGEGSSSFFTRKEVRVAPINIQEDHIENVNLDAYIKDALAQGNYRLAIRYMFLKSLKQLSLNNRIDWHYDKTNSDYYRELENTQLKTNFKQVAYLYDNIWYGEHELDALGFKEAKQDFDRLQKLTTNAR